jgi:hypothetical protein
MNDIKCQFCGSEMCIETWEHVKPVQSYAKCNYCEARGPVVYDEQRYRAEVKAIKEIRDYENRIDADLWRASKGGK